MTPTGSAPSPINKLTKPFGASISNQSGLGRFMLVDNVTIANVASKFGYTSESAFSNTFKQITGLAPSRYRSERIIS